MTLDQFANIAELIGLLIVILTLGFLALQIQQNTKALRATTIQATLQSELDAGALILANVGVWEKIVTAAPLESGEETRLAIGLYNIFMIETENRFHQYHSGYLASQTWEGRHGTLPRMIGLPVFKLWRNSVGGMSHSADFLALLDKLVDESSNSESLVN